MSKPFSRVDHDSQIEGMTYQELLDELDAGDQVMNAYEKEFVVNMVEHPEKFITLPQTRYLENLHTKYFGDE